MIVLPHHKPMAIGAQHPTESGQVLRPNKEEMSRRKGISIRGAKA